MRMLLDLDEIALRFKVLDDAAARFIAVKAFIFAAEAVDGGVVVHHADLLQTVTLADEKVVRVMRRGDFHAAGPEFLVDILVRDDGDFPPDERQNQRFADEFGITLVLRADGNGGISQQRLGTGGGDDNIAVRTLDRIADMPEVTGLLLIFDLGVRKGGAALGAPVDDAVAAVDQPLFIQADEHLAHGF